MLGDKKGVVNYAHGLVQARMQRRTIEQLVVALFNGMHKMCARSTKIEQNSFEFVLVVICIVCLGVLQVGWTQRRRAKAKIQNTTVPQFFQVEQMSGVFLNRPFAARLGNQTAVGYIVQALFKTSRRTTQPLNDHRQHFIWQTEFELAFEPFPGSVQHILLAKNR